MAETEISVDYSRWPWKQPRRTCRESGCHREAISWGPDQYKCFDHNGYSRVPEPSFVYVLESPAASLIKVGLSGNVERRLQNLSSTHKDFAPFKIVLTAPGCDKTEASLLAHLRRFHRFGEWFDAGAETWREIWAWFDEKYNYQEEECTTTPPQEAKSE